MNSLIIFIIGITLIGLLLPKSVSTPTGNAGRARLPFVVFVLVLASSPVLGALFAISIDIEVSTGVALCFSWIGVAASLPLALLVARLLGQQGYAEFWEYLEASFRSSRSRIRTFWVAVSATAFVVGMVVFVLSETNSILA